LRTKEQGTHLTLNEHDDDEERDMSKPSSPLAIKLSQLRGK